ncbi:hypothetical protein DRP04_10090 [Archaeoglobales archaeon]|nr:MAG: hypothetical protein DRP04_10090 [Archaeoglobales archaeon]
MKEKPYPFRTLEKMSTEAAIYSAFCLLFALLAVLKGAEGKLIDALQLEIFSLLFLILYEHEITKRLIRKVRKNE